MKISIKQIDHILIAVSNDEFNDLKTLSKSDSRIIYKKTIDKDWTWEAIYLGFKDNIYLEIVLKDNYPSKIGLAISSLGDEENIIEGLNSNLPDLEVKERATKNGKPWYNAYFCSRLESKACFIWFMEYIGDFKTFRKTTVPNEIPIFGERVVLNLDKNTILEFLEVINLCGLNSRKEKSGFQVFDDSNRSFLLMENESEINVVIN